MDFKDKRLMMSKEEARNRAKELLNENQVDLITKYMFLEQQVQKQKEVIDRAIEYIKEKQKIQYKFALSHIECDDLLEILKGDSNAY